MADRIRYDLDGQEIVTNALMELINDFPMLEGNEKITFASLGEASGKAIFPTSGSAIRREIVDVTGHVEQECEYPFVVVYRANGLSEARKKAVREWLDSLGRWLEKQPISVGTEEYKLDEYPALTRGRVFTKISRMSTAYLDSINESKSENWIIDITATYRNEFDK